MTIDDLVKKIENGNIDFSNRHDGELVIKFDLGKGSLNEAINAIELLKKLKVSEKALELMAAWIVGDGISADLCQCCVGEQQELCNGYNRLHNTKEECIKTIVDYYLVEANDD